jgi:hypothetical protein
MLSCSINCDENSNVAVIQNIYISQRESSSEYTFIMTQLKQVKGNVKKQKNPYNRKFSVYSQTAVMVQKKVVTP